MGRWLDRTHSQRFELCRHFFLRFFDSDLVSQPGQWRTVGIGVFAVLFSLGFLYIPGLYKKYLVLGAQHRPELYRASMYGDLLCAITLAMTLVATAAAVQWQSLFPGLRDYLALASLPVRTRTIFLAKGAALGLFLGILTLGATLLPSVMLPAVFAGPDGGDGLRESLGLLISSSLGAMFACLALVCLQGLILAALPGRWSGGVSVGVQGAVLAVLLCGLPFVFSVSNVRVRETAFLEWAWAPPVWFLGLDRVIAGGAGAEAGRAAGLAWAGLGLAAILAPAVYWAGCGRHRLHSLEGKGGAGSEPTTRWTWLDRWAGDPRQSAVLAFVGKTLRRSPRHRLILLAFVAIAFALISDSLISLALGRAMGKTAAAATAARTQAAVSVPLALSLFVLAGLRYLFRLPAELRANWVFRIHEPGHAPGLMAAVERFLVWAGAVPVALLTLPLEMRLLGAGRGVLAGAMCLLASFVLVEFLLSRWRTIPFTSAYLPGQRPVIQVLIYYGAAVAAYVTALGGLVAASLWRPELAVAVSAAMLLLWGWLRANRRERLREGRLEFEEVETPVVSALQVNPD